MRLSEINSPGFRSPARLRRAAAAAAFLFFVSAPAFGPAPAGAQSADDNRLLTITGWSSDGSAGEVRALLGRGANPNVTDSTGRTPVHRSASIGNSQRTLRVLLEGGGRTDLKDGNGDTPLHLAAAASPTLWESDSINAIEVLLSHSAQPDAANRKGETPLHIVARTHSSSTDGVAALLKAGASPNRADARGDAPLHAAIGEGRMSAVVIEALLDGGADPKKRNRTGLTALQLFVLRGWSDESVVAMLVAAGADPNRKYPDGDAPLHAAVRNSGKHDVVEGLLGGGADPCARDSGGKIPWRIAGGKERVRAALERAKGHEIDCEKKKPREEANTGDANLKKAIREVRKQRNEAKGRLRAARNWGYAISVLTAEALGAKGPIRFSWADFTPACERVYGFSRKTCQNKLKELVKRARELKRTQGARISQAEAEIRRFDARLRELCRSVPQPNRRALGCF